MSRILTALGAKEYKVGDEVVFFTTPSKRPGSDPELRDVGRLGKAKVVGVTTNFTNFGPQEFVPHYDVLLPDGKVVRGVSPHYFETEWPKPRNDLDTAFKRVMKALKPLGLDRVRSNIRAGERVLKPQTDRPVSVRQVVALLEGEGIAVDGKGDFTIDVQVNQSGVHSTYRGKVFKEDQGDVLFQVALGYSPEVLHSLSNRSASHPSGAPLISRTLTARDRSSLIRLASSLPVGSKERRSILSGLMGTPAKSAANRGPDSAWGGGDRKKLYDDIRRETEQAEFDEKNPEWASYQNYRKLPKHRTMGGIGAKLHPVKSNWVSVYIEEADGEEIEVAFGPPKAKALLGSTTFEVPGAELIQGNKIMRAKISSAGYIEVPNSNYKDALYELQNAYAELEERDYNENRSQSSMEAYLMGEIEIAPSDLEKKAVWVKCSLAITGYAEADNHNGRTRKVRFGVETIVIAKFHKSAEFSDLLKKDGLFDPIGDPRAEEKAWRARYFQELDKRLEEEKKRKKKKEEESDRSGLDDAALDDAARYLRRRGII